MTLPTPSSVSVGGQVNWMTFLGMPLKAEKVSEARTKRE